jgi:hypothetical protein
MGHLQKIDTQVNGGDTPMVSIGVSGTGAKAEKALFCAPGVRYLGSGEIREC